MQETITIISSVIAIISTAGALIYKVFLKKGDDREQEYYTKLLKPFIHTLRNNKDIDAIKYVKANIPLEDDCIPKYVTYLVDKGKGEKETLKKILIRDYFSLYSNNENKIENTLDKISKLLIWVLWGVAFCLIFVACFAGVTGIFGMSVVIIVPILTKETIVWNDVLLGGAQLAIGMLLFLIAWLIMKAVHALDEDRYTFKKKKIESKIRRKVKYYDKHKDELIY